MSAYIVKLRVNGLNYAINYSSNNLSCIANVSYEQAVRFKITQKYKFNILSATLFVAFFVFFFLFLS